MTAQRSHAKIKKHRRRDLPACAGRLEQVGTALGKQSGGWMRWMPLSAVVMLPPIPPGIGVVAQRRAGDYTQRRVYPAARRGIERIVVQEIEQIGNRAETLILGEHAGLGEAASSALADQGRRVVRESIEERIDCGVGAQHGEAFNCPVACFFISV